MSYGRTFLRASIKFKAGSVKRYNLFDVLRHVGRDTDRASLTSLLQHIAMPGQLIRKKELERIDPRYQGTHARTKNLHCRLRLGRPGRCLGGGRVNHRWIYLGRAVTAERI